jgi:hypothetical protein
MNWKNAFELDLGIAQRREQENQPNRKLTGRELFQRDTTLIDSDIKFLTAAGESIESVKIDESLFQNIDDLELDDESDPDDADWHPGQDDSD